MRRTRNSKTSPCPLRHCVGQSGHLWVCVWKALVTRREEQRKGCSNRPCHRGRGHVAFLTVASPVLAASPPPSPRLPTSNFPFPSVWGRLRVGSGRVWTATATATRRCLESNANACLSPAVSSRRFFLVCFVWSSTSVLPVRRLD